MVTVISCVCLVLVGQPPAAVWRDTLWIVMEELAVSHLAHTVHVYTEWISSTFIAMYVVNFTLSIMQRVADRLQLFHRCYHYRDTSFPYNSNSIWY